MSAKNLKGNCYALAATSTGATEALLPTDANLSSVDLWNSGAAGTFVTSGSSTALALANAVLPTPGSPQKGTMVAPGAVETLTKQIGDTALAGITLSGTATIYCSLGSGE